MDQPAARVVSIVDDDASIRRSVRNLLLSKGFRAESFESAEAFLQSAHRGDTGCLVLDLRMPGMDGLGLLAYLASQNMHIPVVILTAHGDEDARRRTLGAGAIAFLNKPFRSDALVEAVESAMRNA